MKNSTGKKELLKKLDQRRKMFQAYLNLIQKDKKSPLRSGEK